jgi:amino acid adenylation domain-containing protein
MNVFELLSALDALGVRVWAEGEGLRYSAPKGALTPDLLARLRQHKADIIEFLRKAEESAGETLPPIEPAPRDGPLPLSFAQQRLWFLNQLKSEHAAYNIPLAWRLTGSLDVVALGRSLTEIVRRHESLRTTFETVDGQALQKINPSRDFDLPLIDLQSLAEDERRAESQRLVIEHSDAPFDLTVPPLIRAALLRLGHDSHLLLVAIDHIACDGWSLGIFFQELATLYAVFSKGAQSPLPELTIQYADFARWQRLWLQGETLEKQLGYWKKQLAGAPPVLQLPTDRARPAVQTFRGSIEQFHLSGELLERLRQLGQQTGATMFTILLSAFKTLLARYNGQQDIVVGSPTANRRHRELEPLIGFFANTLILRTDLSGDPTFRELLNRMRLVTTGAFAHQDVPFEKLVEELKPQRDLNRNPLVQVLFVLQNAFKASVELEGLTLSWESEVRAVRFDLELHIWDAPQGLLGTFMYSTDLFDAATIARMAGHFQNLLEAMAANPDQRLSELPLLTEAERLHLLKVSRGGVVVPVQAGAEVDVSQEHFVHRLFEAQAARTPGAVALTSGDESLTYGDLNARANQLAHYLQSLGVCAEMPIAICMERGPLMALALLGILKAGAACVPLEPSDPPERLALMLADAQCSVLLSQQSLSQSLPQHDGKLILLDSEWSTIARHKDENPSCDVTAENLAYLTYAGGHSVALEHRGLLRRLNLLQEKIRLTASDVVMQQAAPDEDAFVWELCWPLLAGARVLMVDDEKRLDQDYLRRIIASQKVSIVRFATPALSAFVAGLSAKDATGLISLRAIFCGGEPLRRASGETLFKHLSCELYNLYYHAEASGFLLSQVDLSAANAEVLPAGHPAGITVYVLDQHLQMVPAGVTGEIYLGGDALARGYWRAPQETARRFVVNPFDETEGARLFKTGDTGRWLKDDQLEVSGSVGRLAWAGGYRIALEEVEAAILQEPSVDECVVLARPTEINGIRLAAYVVASGPLPLERLLAHLKARLPAHMMPSALVPIYALPLTASGQVDEEALASLEVIDEELARRWEDALRALPGIENAAVLIHPPVKHLPPLHLSDLLPEDGTGAATAGADAHRALAKSNGREVLPVEANEQKPAFSDGGPLEIETSAPQTLDEALVQTATKYPGKGIVYVQADGSRLFQTYASLLEDARRILAGLRGSGLQDGDRAILQIPSLADHFPAFWACLLGGITPVTVAVAASYEEENAVVNKLYNAWELLGRPPVLTSDALVASLEGLRRFLPTEQLRVLSISSMRQHPPVEQIHRSKPDDVAFFQLTSGSTGIPKCIQITHRGIIRHVHAARQFNSYEPEDVSLNWLPMDHVVPILTCHLKDTYLGCQQIAVSTNVVLAEPLKWLDLMHEYRVTQTWSPNFGFKLVSDALSKARGRSWDLSPVRFFMNAGEQVTLPVVREFLELVAPFGVPQRAMQPAFGMAEACTCMTYQNEFDCETGVHRIVKASLGGRLERAGHDEAEVIEFIDLGGPVPGVQIRIADQHNQLLAEGVVGRFQIKGGVITPGYLNNESANAEAFVGDGWFNSGDLGFIHDGRLTLTGREKELIIINGANFYCYEIEDVVNQLEGVEPTYVAACGFNDPHAGTEGLAIFFTPRAEGIEQNVELIKAIRKRVTQNLGISPAHVVPVPKSEFPKTTSGKIQRTKLKNSLAAGHFRELLREIDIRLENANTLPDWFYKKVWRRRQSACETVRPHAGPYLVFSDPLGLGQFLCAELRLDGQRCISVEAGADFAQAGTDSYRINPHDPEHYERLLESLEADKIRIREILHLWTYDKTTGADNPGAQALEQAQEQGVYSLLRLAQALAKAYDERRPVSMLVVSNLAQAVKADDPIAYAHSSLPGLLKTLSQEMPWLACLHVDVRASGAELSGRDVLKELSIVSGEQQVAYREGERWVPRLEKVEFAQAAKRALPFKQGGIYLLSGGLGGVGVLVAKYLLKHYRARLLLLGRTELPERSTWQTHLERTDILSQRIEACLSLEQLEGEFIYMAVDVCDLERLRHVVAEAESRWGGKLDGVLHLAGVFQERSLIDETTESVQATLRPKILGAWSLHQIIDDNPHALFIGFSSVNSFFGGIRAGAYAAANSFLEGITDWQQRRGRAHCYCFHWSQWHEIGMSRHYKMKELASARGYYALSPGQGLHSMLAGLHQGASQLLIGLDGSKPHIRRHVAAGPYHAQKLTAYYTASRADAADLSIAALQGSVIRDRFLKRSVCDFVQLKEMPLTSAGEVDRERLMSGEARRASRAQVMPRTEIEHQLARIWQEVLSVPRLSVHSNFFEHGGHSLLAVRLISLIRDGLRVEFPLDKMIEAPTIAGMARWIEENSPPGETLAPQLPACLLPLQPGGSGQPFFCVHPAGGSPLCYLNLASQLGTERPFYGFQSPGLLDLSQPLTQVEEMAALYVEAMRAVQPHGPYLLGGWSSAGPTIFEMARLLEKQHEKVAVLAFLDCGLMESDIPMRQGNPLNPLHLMKVARIFLTFAWDIGVPRSYAQLRGLAMFVGISLPSSLREILRRDFSSKLKFMRSLLSDMRRSARVYRSNTMAGLKYEPAPYGGTATLFRAAQSNANGTDPVLDDLRKFATGGVEKYVIPGNHMSIILGQAESKALVEKLRECLNRV